MPADVTERPAMPKWGQHDLDGKPHNIMGGGAVSLCHPDCPAWEQWLEATGYEGAQE